jgi:hypothetical protein
LNWLIRFMPLAPRTIQNDGLTIFRIRYWHPIFNAWRETRKQLLVRYHPEDISRIFVSPNGRNHIEVGYADVRRPRISLWEQRAICRILRAQGQRQISEAMIFKAIDEQREIVARARSETAGRSANFRPPNADRRGFHGHRRRRRRPKKSTTAGHPNPSGANSGGEMAPTQLIHLHPSARAEAMLDEQARLDVLQRDRWIDYPTSPDDPPNRHGRRRAQPRRRCVAPPRQRA